MNKKLLAKINRALENTKATCMAPVTKEALQKRLTEELDWADADPDHWAFIQLLNDVMEKVRSAGIEYYLKSNPMRIPLKDST